MTYTGNGATNATVGHGLNAVPSMIVVKSTNGASDWEVMHKSLPTNYGLRLDTTSAQINLPSATAGGGLSTSPTSSTFSFVSGTSNANNVNENTRTWVAYVFSEVPGFSKFGSYVGNGSADGPFVYTGFKPKYVLIKDITAASSWLVRDSVRSSQNPNNLNLNPNNSQAEGTTDTPAASHITDLLSNGFKLRANGGADNASGRTYIYAAFAEVPFGGAGISPANAR
ncbi:MAG: hypothetical protein QG650_1032 [Patescibacteria group bacterium]|nr:hypothetical protein [Patescibacteria group bacterium]